MTEEAVSPPAPLRTALRDPVTVDRVRLGYIDNLRILLVTLVIVAHMAITYGAPIGEWYYREEGKVSSLYAFVTVFLLGIGASFLIGLFFLIAGHFSPGPCDRKGPRQFIRDRLVRLGLPLLLFALVINPLVTYWAAVAGGYVGSLPVYVVTHLPALGRASVGPLWFVEALLAFSLAYALGHALFPSRIGPSSLSTIFAVPGSGTIALVALGLGLVTFIVRIWAPFGWWLEPVHQEPAHWPHYIALFAIGSVAYRQDWLARISSSQARLWGWAALALVPGWPLLAVAAGALRGEFDPAVTGGATWLSLAYSVWETFIGLALVIWTLSWFRDHFNRQGSLARVLSDCTYAVYVLHPMIIVPLALALRNVQLPLFVKFALFAPLAVATSFLIAYMVRQVPIVKSVL